MARYIYQHSAWPRFSWDTDVLLADLLAVHRKLGQLNGQLNMLGFSLRSENYLETLTEDVLKTSEIEGELLNRDEVRSSVARHLGMNVAGMVNTGRHVDGVVEMMLDATRNFQKPLTADRLYGWHASLFPGGRSGMQKITVGKYRKAGNGPMQVVSGPMGREKVHFEAPPSGVLPAEMKAFLAWFNRSDDTDAVLRSGLAHLWFVTLHPFDDGKGRMARALADMMLCRADGSAQRYYSMSSQIRTDRKAYYIMLEKTQKGKLNVTAWLQWYLKCLLKALQESDKRLTGVVSKTVFWDRFASVSVNERQRKMINRMFDGFDGKLTSSKWAKMCKCSADTALRDIRDLMDKKMLVQDEGGGRSTSYLLRKIK